MDDLGTALFLCVPDLRAGREFIVADNGLAPSAKIDAAGDRVDPRRGRRRNRDLTDLRAQKGRHLLTDLFFQPDPFAPVRAVRDPTGKIPFHRRADAVRKEAI